MKYMDIISGTKVKTIDMFGEEKIGTVSSCHYSAGIKGIGSGWTYLVEFPNEIGLEDFNEDQIEAIESKQ